MSFRLIESFVYFIEVLLTNRMRRGATNTRKGITIINHRSIATLSVIIWGATLRNNASWECSSKKPAAENRNKTNRAEACG